MPRFEVTRRTSLPADHAFARVTDWKRHGDFLPLTSVSSSSEYPGGRMVAFNARTALGPVGFDDPMEVTTWRRPTHHEPGVARLVKRGRVVHGWAVITVTPTAEGASVSWVEDAHLRLVGPLLNWPTRLVARLTFGRLIDGLLAGSTAGR